MQLIFVTLSIRHSASGCLYDEAPLNIACMLVTLSTFQAPTGWSNDEAPQNMQVISVTLSTFQSPSLCVEIKFQALHAIDATSFP